MPAILQNTPPLERRNFQISGAQASITGTTNTNVVAFNTVTVLLFGQTFNVTNASSSTPSAGSGGWINVVNSATLGTTFKFLRRGYYHFDVFIPTEAQEVTPAGINVALTLDSAAANLLAAGTVLPTTVNVRNERGVFGFSAGSVAVDSALGINFSGRVAISDTLAVSTTADLPAAVAGATGIGVVRLHLNDNAGGVIAASTVTAGAVTLWCGMGNDLAG